MARHRLPTFLAVVVIQEQEAPAVRADNGAGRFSLYAAYPHGTLILTSAMTAEEYVGALYALESCKLGAGVARLALSFWFGQNPCPLLSLLIPRSAAM
jgi:hypothetical protein